MNICQVNLYKKGFFSIMSQLNNKIQDLWTKQKQELVASKRALKEELTLKIENEILKMFSEFEINENSDKIFVSALPYEVANKAEKSFSFNLKLILQEFKDKTLVNSTVRIIQIHLNKKMEKVIGPVCYNVDPEERNILVLPFFLFFSKNNYLDLTNEVINPLLGEINPLTA